MIPSPSIRHLPAVLALLLGSALASSAQAVTYKAKDIGSVAPGQCYYNEMNAKGQIVGACYDAEGLNYTAYATDANGKNIHTIGLLSGSWSWTNGLNDNGVLVGDATIAGDLVSHAWIKQPSGAMTDLGTLGGDNSYALNVNNKGLIVGISEFDTLGSGVHGFVINPGSTTMIDVGSLGGTQMGLWEVNNKGVIGGFGSLAGDTEFRGFHAKPPYNKLIVMDTLGGTNSSVRGINDNGVIVGITRTAGDLVRRAFVAQVGSKAITELATPAGRNAGAFGINNLGQIVGQVARATDNRYLAFVCTGDCTDLVDLNTVTTGLPLGIELRNANDINDKGQIGAVGSDGHNYLLTPQ